MRGEVDKYLGIVLLSVVFYYIFKDASATSTIIKAISGANTNAVSALQGRQVNAF